jgi:hypothetical protein
MTTTAMTLLSESTNIGRSIPRSLEDMPFVLRSRTLATMGSSAGRLDHDCTLETVRDYLKAYDRDTNPHDRILDLGHMGWSFRDHTVTGGEIIMGKNGKPQAGERWHMTSIAWNKLCGNDHLRLPPRGRGMVEWLCDSVGGRQIAQQAMYEATKRRDGKRSLVRFRNLDGMNYATAVLGENYSVYDNLDMVEDFLAEMGNMTVLSFRHTDTGITFRCLDGDPQDAGLNVPVPTLDGWNSGVGRKSAGYGAGNVRLVCLNGMTSHELTAQKTWRHSGRQGRIREQMIDSLGIIRTKQSGLISAYRQAMDIQIENVTPWMDDLLHSEAFGSQSDIMVARIHEGMEDATSSPAGTLANVIDGITFAAHQPLLIEDSSSTLDIFDQWNLEKVASRVMAEGIRQAEKGVITVEA